MSYEGNVKEQLKTKKKRKEVKRLVSFCAYICVCEGAGATVE